MKLRNKKTGEILVIGNIIVENPERIDCVALTKCSSLAELNEEWEDYEEPKVFYYLNENGGVLQYTPSEPEGEDKTYIKYQKAIGNYFETKEEAEKAVEKLKAWKRLRDKGFRINPNYSADGATINHKDVILCRFEAYYDDYGEEDNIEAGKDLDLLFWR